MEDEEEKPAPQTATTSKPMMKKRKRKANAQSDFQWKKARRWRNPISSTFETVNLKFSNEVSEPLSPFSSPVKYFWLLFDNAFLEFLTSQTNLYNVWRNISKGSTLIETVRKIELIKIIGMALYVGIVKLPSPKMYGAAAIRIHAIADAMSRNRFDEILSTMHFSDNNLQKRPSENVYDRLFKTRPVVEHLKKVLKSTVLLETYHAIDEMMIPFKGRHGLKMYMPKKPTKWRNKLWCRAGISGNVYDFEVAAVEHQTVVSVDSQFGSYESVVARLTPDLQPKNHKFFF